MGTAGRRQREKEALRARILDAARELFATEGYEATSMRRIADRIEYSPTAIYHHFSDKQGLLRELCRTDFATLASELGRLAEVRDPVERIHRLGSAYVDFAVRFPNHYRFMFMTPHPSLPPEAEDRARLSDPDRDAYAFLRATVAEAMTAGRIRPGSSDPDLVAQALWAAVHGVAALAITREHDPWVPMRPAADIAGVLLALIDRGLSGKG